MSTLRVFNGCYDASRASALSGVPKSTVYWWARHGIVVPSVSPVQEKLWSYGDLIALRLVSWLRHVKTDADGVPFARSPMPEVRRAFAMLEERRLDVWDADSRHSPLLVAANGSIYVRHRDEVIDLHGAPPLPQLETFGLTEPFEILGIQGPDLLRPREHLRIVPGRVSGEPHVEDTRITSLALGALATQGFSNERIAEMYEIGAASVADAISLERQLGSVREPAA